MTKKMNVATGPVFDEFGGVSQHILGIERYSSQNISIIPSKIARMILGKSDLRRKIYRKCLNKIHLNCFDVVHSHANPWFTSLCQISKTNKCKWIHTYHTLYFDEDYINGLNPGQKEHNLFLVNVASQADIRISVSKWLHDYLSEKHSIQTEIIPNGVDLEACTNAKPQRFIRNFGVSDFILYVGYLDPIKNPLLFVNLAYRMPEIKFVMIGRNLDAINMKLNYGINFPKNLFQIDEMKHDDVLDAISACKVYVMTSKREGIPTTLLEAMGMSKPVVVPMHSGCYEVIQSNKYGFLYKPDSIDDLIEKTRFALEPTNIGENSRERVLKNYDWKLVVKKIDALYERQ